MHVNDDATPLSNKEKNIIFAKSEKTIPLNNTLSSNTVKYINEDMYSYIGLRTKIRNKKRNFSSYAFSYNLVRV